MRYFSARMQWMTMNEQSINNGLMGKNSDQSIKMEIDQRHDVKDMISNADLIEKVFLFPLKIYTVTNLTS